MPATFALKHSHVVTDTHLIILSVRGVADNPQALRDLEAATTAFFHTTAALFSAASETKEPPDAQPE